MEKEIIESELKELAKHCECGDFIKAGYVCLKHKINLDYIATVLSCISTCADNTNVYLFHKKGITILATVIDSDLYLNKEVFSDNITVL